MSSVDTEIIASRLTEIVGATHISSAPADVDAYGGLDPFLVVWPGAAPEVAKLLKTCNEQGVAVGVSACGTRATRHWPVQDDRPRLALDTRRMINILDVDDLSLTVHSQCGIQIQHLEEALRRQGLTLGPYPASIQRHTLGGLLAAPHPLAHSPQVGWLVDACVGISVAHTDGSVVHTRVAPRRATGPDLARLYLGSRGALGVITTAVLRVHRIPERETVVAFATPGLPEAVDAARSCLVRGILPARLRVLERDQAVEELGEMAANLPAVLLAVLAGPATRVFKERQGLAEILVNAGGSELPQSLANRWWAHQASPAAQSDRVTPVGTMLLYSELRQALAALPGTVKRTRVLTSVDQFSLQGACVWFSAKGVGQGAIRSALLDVGLDPFRLSFPPLMEELRHQLDPGQTLVLMEA